MACGFEKPVKKEEFSLQATQKGIFDQDNCFYYVSGIYRKCINLWQGEQKETIFRSKSEFFICVKVKNDREQEIKMGVDFFDEGDSVVVRMRGMRECIAYIREEALAYQLDSVAEFLKAACRELDDGLDDIDERPSSLRRMEIRKYQ